MMSLTPGPHLFTSEAKNLTFEYIVHAPSPSPPKAPTNHLIIIQCPAWGIGSQYLQTGLTTHLTQKNHTLVFFHPRGTDNSSRPANPSEMSSMPHLSSDLDDLRRHLRLDAFPVLLGHSNGGAIALGYAEMFPSRVKKLILVSHQLVGLKGRDMRGLHETRIRYCRGRGRTGSLRESNFNSNARIERTCISSITTPNTAQETDDEEEENRNFTAAVNSRWPLYFSPSKQQDQDQSPPLTQLLSALKDRIMPVYCYRSVYGCDENLTNPLQMVEGLGRVRAKTLIIAGADDLICGVGVAERSWRGISGSRMVVYEGCGHFPWIEVPGRFWEDVEEFLGG